VGGAAGEFDAILTRGGVRAEMDALLSRTGLRDAFDTHIRRGSTRPAVDTLLDGAGARDEFAAILARGNATSAFDTLLARGESRRTLDGLLLGAGVRGAFDTLLDGAGARGGFDVLLDRGASRSAIGTYLQGYGIAGAFDTLLADAGISAGFDALLASGIGQPSSVGTPPPPTGNAATPAVLVEYTPDGRQTRTTPADDHARNVRAQVERATKLPVPTTASPMPRSGSDPSRPWWIADAVDEAIGVITTVVNQPREFLPDPNTFIGAAAANAVRRQLDGGSQVGSLGLGALDVVRDPAAAAIVAAHDRVAAAYDDQRAVGGSKLGAGYVAGGYSLLSLMGVVDIEEAIRGTTLRGEELSNNQRWSQAFLGVGSLLGTLAGVGQAKDALAKLTSRAGPTIAETDFGPRSLAQRSGKPVTQSLDMSRLYAVGAEPYGARRLELLGKYLDKRGVDLVIDPNAVGGRFNFITSTGRPRFVVGPDVKAEVVWHELGHFIQWRRVGGTEAYRRLPREYGNHVPEQFVFDLLQQPTRWERLSPGYRWDSLKYIIEKWGGMGR
jgi:hypothetical protein